jgi:hypothetical protein
LKARGWYRGKGSHKPEVEVRLQNVSSGPWGARIQVYDPITHSTLDVALTRNEADYVSQKIVANRGRAPMAMIEDDPPRCDGCHMNPDVCTCEFSAIATPAATPEKAGGGR